MVPLQPLGNQRPVICLAGIDGHFLNFRHIPGLLGEDRPMFGLQAVGISGESRPLNEIAEIAQDHVRTVRAAMPQGPYNLVGFSFGGIVAYEMAQILRREGEQVALALIDCSTGVPAKATLIQSLAFHFRYARQLPVGKRWQYFMQRIYGYWLGVKFKLRLIDWERRLEGLIDVKGTYAHVAAMNIQALTRINRPRRWDRPCSIAPSCEPTGPELTGPIRPRVGPGTLTITRYRSLTSKVLTPICSPGPTSISWSSICARSCIRTLVP